MQALFNITGTVLLAWFLSPGCKLQTTKASTFQVSSCGDASAFVRL